MRSPFGLCRALAFACVATFALAAAAQAQTGYGVNSNGTLFRFDVNSTGTVSPVGPVGFVPEGIDFRPGTSTLYALDVGATTTQLYTINIQTGEATPVGDGFPSQVTGQGAGNYSLLNASIGFDVNPTTLQADGSVRIRVVASTGSNLRLNSDTGEIAAVDTPLDYPDADTNAAATPMVDAAAYINSARAVTSGSGTTSLYVIDFGTDDLVLQNPPNSGTLNTVGPLGATVNANAGIGFDIVTDPASTDAGIGGDRAYAVLTRSETNGGAYLLYDVNLSTGQITGGRIVGSVDSPANFAGGFAVLGDLVSAGGLIISEFRFRGPGTSPTPGASQNDEFIELYNASGSDIVVSAADGSEGYSVAASVPTPAGLKDAGAQPAASTRLFVIPNGKRIPARGHYLAVNSLGFSLSNYPADTPSSGVSFGDNTYTQDIGDAEGIAVFNTSNTAKYSTTTRLDAAGFAAPVAASAAKPSGVTPSVSDPLFVEGAGIPSPVTFANQHSFLRRLEGGPPRDTNVNADDFVLVSTDPTQFEGNPAAVLGAPGPESSLSPIQRNDLVKASLIDPGCTYTENPALACGTTRDATADAPNNSPNGTLRIRRRWTNMTGAPVSRLRFRVVDITTLGSPDLCNGCDQADLRVRTSSDETGLTLSGGGTANTRGLTLEVPSTANAGGLNSSLSVTLETPILDTDSINVNFLLGVADTGFYRFFVNVEVLNQEEPQQVVSPASKVRGTSKPASRKGGGRSR
jgi:hypothetical protein